MKLKTQPNAEIQKTIRVPKTLDNWLLNKALLENRSFNRQVVFLLEKERSADLLSTKCIGNMHIFKSSKICSCGKAAKVE